MDLKQYDRIKSVLAEILRSVATRTLPVDGEEITRDLFARLAEDRFNLVVVGRFSRGKTSLMNAMLGTERLPTGVVPVTSVITTVNYGSEEKVVLYYQHTNLFLDIPVSELADHITERGNPGNRRRIRTAEVQLPAELLRRGFYFIDTPGLGSSIVENTRTTEEFLSEADAFILVTSYDSPLSEEEQRILQTIHKSGRRVFLVLNKRDCVDAAQRQQVHEHVEVQLAAIYGNAVPPYLSVSAREALEARLQQDAQQFSGSGLPDFEAALLSFLVNDKRRDFLAGMCGRIGAILAGQIGAEQDAARLAGVRNEIGSPRQAIADTEQAIPWGTTISPALPPCEVCTHVADAVFGFMAKYQQQLHGDRAVQNALAERRGLCGPHTWQFEAIAAPTQICTGFAGVVERQAAYLRAAGRKQPDGALTCQAVEDALSSAETCIACEVAREAVAQTVTSMANRLARNGDAALRDLSAICLPHLHLLLSVIEDPALAATILLREADVMDRLAEDMRHFAMKRDGLRRHLTTREEAAASTRALRMLVENQRAQMGPPRSRLADNVTPLSRFARQIH